MLLQHRLLLDQVQEAPGAGAGFARLLREWPGGSRARHADAYTNCHADRHTDASRTNPHQHTDASRANPHQHTDASSTDAYKHAHPAHADTGSAYTDSGTANSYADSGTTNANTCPAYR